MNRRRYTLLIDVEASAFRRGVRFWSEALGAPARHSGDPRDPFIELPAASGDVHVELQRINGPGRYHLDLFAPNVDAEARRLEELGATKVKREESWWVMQAPTGHLFCVIPESVPEPDDYDDDFDDDDLDDDDLDDDLDDLDEIDEDDEVDDDDAAEDEDEADDEEDDEPEPPRQYPRLRSVPNPKD
jgi:Glyoxalase-like domain